MSSTFNDFGLPPKLLQALARINFMTPTPIQDQTIPLAMQGRDILGSAQTGTGKTGAFGIPLIAGLMEDPSAMAIVLTPTRELAAQVVKSLQSMIPVPTIKTALLIGGEAMPKQFHQLNNKPRLIVGTPGRVNDHLDRGTLKLDQTRFLVLDETDRMLDMGFGIQIDKILTFVPKDRQTMLFSATLPKNIVKLSSKYMRDPARVAVGSTTTPAAKIDQEMIHTTDAEKFKHLVDQLDQREGSVIIFVKTKHGTERLAEKLNRTDHRADAIHGDLRQRQRDRVIASFREKKYRVLVATDVAARGLDIPHIAHVVNYDLPQCPEDYIHRIGRTARAGAEGKALNLLTPGDNEKWRAIHRLMHGDSPENRPLPRGSKSSKKSFKRRPSPNKFAGRNEGSERHERADRTDRPERKERFERNDRPHKSERSARPERAERSERPERTEHSTKHDRAERSTNHERAERSAHHERPQRSERHERPAHVERPARAERREDGEHKSRTAHRSEKGTSENKGGFKPFRKPGGKPKANPYGNGGKRPFKKRG